MAVSVLYSRDLSSRQEVYRETREYIAHAKLSELTVFYYILALSVFPKDIQLGFSVITLAF